MKKIVAFTLLLCMILTLAACGKVEITMQEIYDANQTVALLKNHESVYVQEEMDGEVWMERYLTKDYVYDCIPDEEYPFVKFMTDDASYYYDGGYYLRYFFITPDGVGDFASERAETYASVICDEEILDQGIESVSKKDGHITVTGALSSKELEIWVEDGVTAGTVTYVLDAKTREIVSATTDYAYEDGEAFRTTTKVACDAEAPEMVKTFLKYVNQTEELRNVTVVTSPGTEKEVSQSFQISKGMIIGFTWDDAFEDMVELYADAACTEAYDPYADADADLTIYIKWTNT